MRYLDEFPATIEAIYKWCQENPKASWDEKFATLFKVHNDLQNGNGHALLCSRNVATPISFEKFKERLNTNMGSVYAYSRP
jgi:hypothetical protein